MRRSPVCRTSEMRLPTWQAPFGAVCRGFAVVPGVPSRAVRPAALLPGIEPRPQGGPLSCRKGAV